jgi:hypothetical protein
LLFAAVEHVLALVLEHRALVVLEEHRALVVLEEHEALLALEQLLALETAQQFADGAAAIVCAMNSAPRRS